MKIAFNIASLAPGGAERVLADLANYWAEKGHDVSVVLYHASDEPFFEYNSEIKFVSLEKPEPFAGVITAGFRNLRRILLLRRAFKRIRPDCIIPFGDINNVRAIMAAFGLNIRLIASEHTASDYLMTIKNGRIWHFMRRICYRFASMIVVLTEDDRSCFDRALQDRILVIPHAAPPDFPPREPGVLSLPPRFISAMGRFVPEKGFDLLIEAYAKVADRIREPLVIIGDGPQRSELEAQIRKLGLVDRILLPGFVKSPWRELKNSTAFVLSSRVEGFGMVLLEALASGVPAISFDCPNGPRHIIRQGIDGLLVPCGDIEALGEAMDRIVNDERFRLQLAARAPEVKSRFAPETVRKTWDDALEKACCRVCQNK